MGPGRSIHDKQGFSPRRRPRATEQLSSLFRLHYLCMMVLGGKVVSIVQSEVGLTWPGFRHDDAGRDRHQARFAPLSRWPSGHA
jgi:hypothetical protein